MDSLPAVAFAKAGPPGRAPYDPVTEVITPKQRWTIVALRSASIAVNLLDRQVINVLAR